MYIYNSVLTANRVAKESLGREIENCRSLHSRIPWAHPERVVRPKGKPK